MICIFKFDWQSKIKSQDKTTVDHTPHIRTIQHYLRLKKRRNKII